MTGNIYLDLTNEFNVGGLRAILSSGQAVVLHRLALASKDGDWIVREDEPSLEHILSVLESYGARYRLGAPLDRRWMQGGWSAHFEFNRDGSRIRCDFVSHPPRLDVEDLAGLWLEQERGNPDFPVPTIDARRLAHLKATQRDRDYPFIGELARRMPQLRDQFLWSRSARDLMRLAYQHPDTVTSLLAQRPLLAQIEAGRRVLERALDEERRDMAEADEIRLAAYLRSAKLWNENWPPLSRQLIGLPLSQAHRIMVESAEKLLPGAP